MTIDPFANCDFNISSDDCTLQTCCLAQASFLYIPSLGGNAFFTALFAILLLPQLGLGIRYKTWGILVGMACGLILEIVGYAGRVQLHNNPFNDDAFLMYLITLTIAPVFISAAIYLTLTRLIMLYDESSSRFAPRTIALAFMTSDFLSLVLQAAGGAIADIADSGTSLEQSGIDTMIAGLILQVISLAVFLLVGIDFAWRCHRTKRLDLSPGKVSVRNRPYFKMFLASIVLATILILIRSIFRVAELWEGFDGDLWNNETDFLILDGAMIGMSCILLTFFHPGIAFRDQWSAADWTFKTNEQPSSEKCRDSSSSRPESEFSSPSA